MSSGNILRYASLTISQIVTNVVVQIIILLYLIDNNENTSWMILFGSGIGVLIEAWKVNPYVVTVYFTDFIRSLRLWISLLFHLREQSFRIAYKSKVCASRMYQIWLNTGRQARTYGR